MITNASVVFFRMALIYTVIQFTLASRTVTLKSMIILNHPSSENHILQVDVFQLQCIRHIFLDLIRKWMALLSTIITAPPPLLPQDQ
jgi:hypothetical protein